MKAKPQIHRLGRARRRMNAGDAAPALASLLALALAIALAAGTVQAAPQSAPQAAPSAAHQSTAPATNPLATNPLAAYAAQQAPAATPIQDMPPAAPATRPERGDTQGYRFEIITGDDSAVTHRIAEDLYKRLVPTFAAFRTELAQKRRMLYIAVGPTALRDALSRRCDCVVISAYTSSQVWRTLTSRSAGKPRRPAITAIYAEPAPRDQMRLAALLYGRPVRVGVLLGPDTAFLRSALSDAAEVQMYSPGEDLNHALNSMTRSEMLLALPDSDIYNAENVRNILLSTYRRKQGVLGFSSDMVKVGALATTYSEIEDINAQVAEIAAHFVATGALAEPQFPRYFRTIINEGVANSLDLRVTDAARNFARRAPAP